MCCGANLDLVNRLPALWGKFVQLWAIWGVQETFVGFDRDGVIQSYAL